MTNKLHSLGGGKPEQVGVQQYDASKLKEIRCHHCGCKLFVMAFILKIIPKNEKHEGGIKEVPVFSCLHCGGVRQDQEQLLYPEEPEEKQVD